MKLWNEDPMMRECEEAVNKAFDSSQELTDRLQNILTPIQEGQQADPEEIKAATELMKQIRVGLSRAKLAKA